MSKPSTAKKLLCSIILKVIRKSNSRFTHVKLRVIIIITLKLESRYREIHIYIITIHQNTRTRKYHKPSNTTFKTKTKNDALRIRIVCTLAGVE